MFSTQIFSLPTQQNLTSLSQLCLFKEDILLVTTSAAITKYLLTVLLLVYCYSLNNLSASPIDYWISPMKLFLNCLVDRIPIEQLFQGLHVETLLQEFSLRQKSWRHHSRYGKAQHKERLYSPMLEVSHRLDSGQFHLPHREIWLREIRSFLWLIMFFPNIPNPQYSV